MAELKTKPTDQSVDAFLQGVADEIKRQDCYTLLALMEKVTGAKAKMWGDSIVGFGVYHYRYASGREGDWPLTGFSPRKANLTVYIMSGFDEFPELLARLGKHKTAKSCLYLNRLADVDLGVLEEIVARSVKQLVK